MARKKQPSMEVWELQGRRPGWMEKQLLRTSTNLAMKISKRQGRRMKIQNREIGLQSPT